MSQALGWASETLGNALVSASGAPILGGFVMLFLQTLLSTSLTAAIAAVLFLRLKELKEGMPTDEIAEIFA
ncbi:hypothetical protein [Kordiimonas aestuarii]|uniref:hypothetical protein n=1 Tax=Kordiimonas aestuarii TaxID=1005925 RepID=UPI0021D057AF|nr:hypothetical protein [Kordiimonas aestuarii]